MNKEDLEYDVSIAIDKWNEAENLTLAGVGGLSRSDLEALQTCCEYYDQYGVPPPARCFSPKVQEVLSHYGMARFPAGNEK